MERVEPDVIAATQRELPRRRLIFVFVFFPIAVLSCFLSRHNLRLLIIVVKQKHASYDRLCGSKISDRFHGAGSAAVRRRWVREFREHGGIARRRRRFDDGKAERDRNEEHRRRRAGRLREDWDRHPQGERRRLPGGIHGEFVHGGLRELRWARSRAYVGYTPAIILDPESCLDICRVIPA